MHGIYVSRTNPKLGDRSCNQTLWNAKRDPNTRRICADHAPGGRCRSSRRSTNMLWKALIGAIMSASFALAAPSAIAADAAQLSKDAQATLVFPKVTKAGLGIGGQYGDGALIKGGQTVAYYNTAGASVGLQAGAQTYGYALFFMNDKALQEINKAEGFEVGVGPSV